MRRLTCVAAIAMVAFSLTACGHNFPHNRRQAFVNYYPGLASETRAAILNGQIIVGMSPDEVMASWGRPARINDSYIAGKSREQWIYPRGPGRTQYVYFESGHVTGWQNY